MSETEPTPEPKKSALATLRATLLSSGPWPIVVLMMSGLASFVAIVLWAPADTRDFLFGAHGLFFTLLGYFIASPLEK